MRCFFRSTLNQRHLCKADSLRDDAWFSWWTTHRSRRQTCLSSLCGVRLSGISSTSICPETKTLLRRIFAALHTRIIKRGFQYAYSLWPPFAEERLRHCSWLFQEDGSCVPVEVQAPGYFGACQASWKVHEVVFLMLRLSSRVGILRRELPTVSQ